jgi:vancomycin resistance protein VanJ
MSANSVTRYIVRCDARQHQVAIDPARYWRPVRCPLCNAPLDRFRVRRLAAWLSGRAPRSGVRFSSVARIIPIEGFAILWGLGIAVIALLLHTVADDWWLATVLLFLGRWPWIVPAMPLFVLAALLKQKRAAMITLAVTVLCLFGVMGFVTGVGRFVGRSDPASRMRVISYNVNGDGPQPMQLVSLIVDWNPDVLAVQECGDATREQLRAMPDYHSDVGRTCLISRYPIVAIDSLQRENFAAAGGAAWAKRYRLSGPSGEFTFTNLHLDTPRKAFEALMSGRSGAADTIEYKTDVRDLESKLARLLVDRGRGPRLVAGDFNMPTESAIFRRHWSSFTDGFERAGFGFGHSRLAGWIRLRIDHVLADDAWVVKSARVLPDYGSDHLPVMVEVERRR